MSYMNCGEMMHRSYYLNVIEKYKLEERIHLDHGTEKSVVKSNKLRLYAVTALHMRI